MLRTVLQFINKKDRKFFMSFIGYASVSTVDQNLDFQINLLQEAGCVKIFSDLGLSSRKVSRPGWNACLEYLRPEDTLIVWRLDRIAGSIELLFKTTENLEQRSINLRSLSEPAIDTTSAMGKLIFNIFGVLNEFRVDLIRENTMAGLENARKQGRIGGRPVSLTPEKIETARLLQKEGKNYSEIGKILNVHRSTVSNHLKKFAEKQ